MLIAISQRHQKNKHGAYIDTLDNYYIDYLEKFGIKCIVIPNSTTNINFYFDNFPIKGVVLTGGEDVNPRFYGDDVEWPNVSDVRDNTERMIIKLAVERKLPVLGICRGLQFINAYFGGKLVKNIKEEIGEHPPAVNHKVIVDDSVKEFFRRDSLQVNSYHNQGVSLDKLSSELRAFALSEKEHLVEGLYHPQLPIAAIQWHPERNSPDEEINSKLVKAFVNGELFWKK